ncbi:MAG TPA: GGDEF domain-containing protein [Leptospiraceae bacterium]|nr:GGDEF domain-containing protein [Leptospiraceae bacterium]HMZ60180.1 GGDEF domain-containing protein [Leptospiraceae bacterium]HNF16202.1 GGDEF domain-containing protein [Leptospiraceae bacterium]HNF25462.1 GGDEF domain-containing protein [Leptospiraceae bacterium]HNH07531.1 GGDEF domain-containing protein [Leptospiraceae bacterium]
MESFHWNNYYVTDIESVDTQHHRLVDLINEFGNSILDKNNVLEEDLKRLFNSLADYSKFHFSDEEAMMIQAKMDPRHLKYHFKEHTGFLTEVTQLFANISPDNLEPARFLLNFLVHWLAYHILGSDQSMAKQLKMIQSGSTPEQAFLIEEQMRSAATEPLLNALNGLFQQVSERNAQLYNLNRTLEDKVAERTKELLEANQKLEDIAMTDVLTGLPNRRFAMKQFELLWKESETYGHALSCMMIDADYFKQINDSYGHEAGDTVLKDLSRQLQDSTRNDDIVCRLGGDEFLIICPNTPLEGIIYLAEQLRSEVESLRIKAGNGEWKGSVSIGVAAKKTGIQSIDELIRAADKGVYIAKGKGRNSVGYIQ